MRFIQFLLVALVCALAWQATAFASVSTGPACVAAEDGAKQEGSGKSEGEEDEEPECD